MAELTCRLWGIARLRGEGEWFGKGVGGFGRLGGRGWCELGGGMKRERRGGRGTKALSARGGERLCVFACFVGLLCL